MAEFTQATLDELGIESFQQVAEIPTEDLVRLLDEKRPAIHPTEAVLAVMIVSAVENLRKTTMALDAAQSRLTWTTIVVAGAGVLVAIAGVVISL